jgi:signal transduction histidine kinase/ActR/RegA family two-component response regulator
VNEAEPRPDVFLAMAARLWFEDMADRGIVVTDEALVIRAWNAWLVVHTGMAASDAIGQPLFAVCPDIAARGLDVHYRRALEGEVRVLAHRFHRFLIPVVRSAVTGSAHEMLQTARIAPLNADGRIVGTITIVEDVSERVISERELRSQILVAERARAIAEDASQLKDDFLATLSHEIRTPLNAVLGWARILRSKADVKSRDHALDVIERNAAAQLRLVEDLLDMARVISGKLRLDVKSVEIRPVVQAAIDVVEPSAAAKRITIATHAEPSRLVVNADADRLQQAIWNVMSNAVKFTPSGGRIDVRIEKNNGLVEVTVTDTGQGINPEFMPYVFDRFRQADASPSRRHGGLGLGLSLARQIMELHGGSIGARSDGPNKGAEFCVRLPEADGRGNVAIASRSGTSVSTLRGITVLLVDDSDDGREMLGIALRAYGAEVLAVESTDSAVDMLLHGACRPDVVVSDIGMPGSDGYELIRKVRALSLSPRELPAIAVTAYADAEDRLQALAAGYQLHLAKPVDPALVAESIKTLVTRGRSASA